MGRPTDDYKEAAPHADKPRRYRIGKWVTECRLAKGWTMVDVVVRLHARFPDSRLGNQGRIAELETGNNVTPERWTPEVIEYLHAIFQPCPPPPDDPWATSEEFERRRREQEAAAEARRLAELARQQGKPQPGLDAMWLEEAEHV
jgi:hypothetical protein